MAKTLVYQLFSPAWKTGLKGMAEHLSRVAALSVDYVLLSPIYDSPFLDDGYDVANYKQVHRSFDRQYRFNEFIEKAHSYGLGVLMDLPISQTSISHRWFDTHPEYYYWSEQDHRGWFNLYDQGAAWHYLESEEKYYLSLSNPAQADLRWYTIQEIGPTAEDNLQINWPLVYEFRSIIEYWLRRGVDGFRLVFPQGINKDFTSEEQKLNDILFGDKAALVIDAIFRMYDNAFLILECYDPTMGELVEHYAKHTPAEFVYNASLKGEISRGEGHLLRLIDAEAKDSRFMLQLESHNSPRFPSVGIGPKDAILDMFGSTAEGVCLYQGQELGLSSSSKEKLHRKEYEQQEQNPDSCLNYTKNWIQNWRASEPSVHTEPPQIILED